MPSPEVAFVLDALQTNLTGYGAGGYGGFGYGAATLADIPLERIDRDNSDNLDKADGVAELTGPVHEHSDDLEAMNFVEARSVSTADSVLGTSGDVNTERVVGVRLEGAHVSERGAIDPQKGTDNEATFPTWPTIRWSTLTRAVRRAIYVEQFQPGVGVPNVAFKDLRIENQADSSADWSDYYRLDFDVRFLGFESLPTANP